MPNAFDRETIEVAYIDMGDFLDGSTEGRPVALRAIAAAGVDANAADPSGRTILMHLVRFAVRATGKLRRRIYAGIACLLENHADPNLADEDGLTPFDVALKLQQKDVIEILFNHGAKFPSSIQ
jgi:ankyrin repeat protein